MSFDILYHTCNLGTRLVERRNPFTGAVQSVPRGPVDAARALGLRPGQVARLVTLPLALRIMVPSLASEYVGLVKNTSLAVAIGYTELVGIMRTTIEQTNQAVDGLILLVLIYGALNGALAAAILGWDRLTAFTILAEPPLTPPPRRSTARKASRAGPSACTPSDRSSAWCCCASPAPRSTATSPRSTT